MLLLSNLWPHPHKFRGGLDLWFRGFKRTPWDSKNTLKFIYIYIFFYCLIFLSYCLHKITKANSSKKLDTISGNNKQTQIQIIKTRQRQSLSTKQSRVPRKQPGFERTDRKQRNGCAFERGRGGFLWPIYGTRLWFLRTSWFPRLLGVRRRFCLRVQTDSTRRRCWATGFCYDLGLGIREESKRWRWRNWIAEWAVELDGGDCRGRRGRYGGWGTPLLLLIGKNDGIQ